MHQYSKSPSPPIQQNSEVFAMSDIEALENEYQHIIESDIPIKSTDFVDFPLHPRDGVRSPPRRSSPQNLSQNLIRKSPENSSRNSIRKSPEAEINSVKHTIIADPEEDDENDTDYVPGDEETESEDEDYEDELVEEVTGVGDDSYKEANNTTIQDKLSFSLSEIEEEDSENIVTSIVKSLVGWVRGAFEFVFFVSWSMLKQLLRALFGQGYILRAAFMGLLLSVSIFIVASTSSKVLSSLAPSHGVFEHSNLPPRDLDDLSSRLMTVEEEITSLSRLSQTFKDSSTTVNALKIQINQIVERITSLSETDDLASKWIHGSSEEMKGLKSSLSEIEKRLADTSVSVQNELDHGKHLETELVSNKESITALTNSIKSASKKIEILNERVNHLANTENAENIILETLDTYLPSRLVVKYDAVTGGISAAPEFWKYLSSQLSLRGITESSANEPHKEFSFDDFIRHNEKAIDAYLKDYMDKNEGSRSNITENSALVSKEVFKSMLSEELEGIKEETVEALKKLENKLRQDMKKLMSEKRPNSQPNVVEPSLVMNGTQVALDLLIKKSIQKYVAHTISKPDFADAASGARIIPSLTSRSYDWRDGLQFGDRQMRKFLGVLGFGQMKVNRPNMAFTNDVALGDCWPFNGHLGQIGLTLGSLISPSDIGIVHVRADQSPNPTSAPRIVSLWIQIEDEGLRNTISDLIDQQTGVAEEGMSNIIPLPAMPENYVKIMTVEYSLFDSDEFQVFSVPLYVKRLGLATSSVVFRVESNWGHEDYTCLYQLKLFGDTVVPATEEEQTQEHEQELDGYYIKEQPVYSDQGIKGGASFGDDEVL